METLTTESLIQLEMSHGARAIPIHVVPDYVLLRLRAINAIFIVILAVPGGRRPCAVPRLLAAVSILLSVHELCSVIRPIKVVDSEALIKPHVLTFGRHNAPPGNMLLAVTVVYLAVVNFLVDALEFGLKVKHGVIFLFVACVSLDEELWLPLFVKVK